MFNLVSKKIFTDRSIDYIKELNISRVLHCDQNLIEPVIKESDKFEVASKRNGSMMVPSHEKIECKSPKTHTLPFEPQSGPRNSAIFIK